jgi:hypothetical protein
MKRFTLRLVRPESRSVESGQFEVQPEHEEARKILGLMKEFFRNRPPQFRDKLAFLKKSELEMEWLAAPGGVAFVSLLQGNEPVSMCVLLSGKESEADLGILTGYRNGVVEPFLGRLTPEEEGQIFGTERPLGLLTVVPGQPELTPTIHLLHTALAAVFFDAVERMA